MVVSGWLFAWTPAGHFLTVPGVRKFPLSSKPNSALAFIDVILVPGSEDDPKVTFFDVSDASHVRCARFPFLVDTGADHSLLRASARHLLARRGSFPGVHCTGISGGAALPILDAGYLDFVFP